MVKNKQLKDHKNSVSIIIPVLNEASNILRLTQKIVDVIRPLTIPFEIIFVDDGSHDDTWLNITDTAKKFPELRGIQLSRNFGHQNAIMAGLLAAKGQAMITMDGDLQHPPKIIPELISHWQRGYLVVTTSRKEYKAGWFKKLSSKYFSKIFSLVSATDLSFELSDFRLFDRKVYESFARFNDSQLFFRGIFNWLGYSNININVNFDNRLFGKSKFGLLKLMHYAVRAIISFSTKPLLLAIWLGLLTSLFAFVQLINIVIQYFLGLTPPGWATIIAIITLLFGILFITLGIIGAYIANIHEMLQNRPRFIVSDKTDQNTDTK